MSTHSPSPKEFPETGGGTPPVDSNPYNMANWEVLPTIGTHTTEITRHYKDESGLVKTEIETYDHFSQLPVAMNNADNTSGTFLRAKSKTKANVTVRWQWRGTGACPSKVWVQKLATATATVSPDGTCTVSNGLGAPGEHTVEPGTLIRTAKSNKLIEVSSSSGIIEQSFECEATGTASHPNPTYFNIATSGVSYGLALKGVKIRINLTGTYKKGADGERILSPDGEAHVAGGNIYSGSLLGTPALTGWGGTWEYSRKLYGLWVDPFHHWEDDTRSWIDSILLEHESVVRLYQFSAMEVKSIPTSGPKTKEMKLKVKDTGTGQDPTEIDTKLNLFIYAPLMNTVLVAVTPVMYSAVKDFSTPFPGFSAGRKGIGCTYGQREVIWDIFGYLGSAADISGAFTKNPWLIGVTAAAGFVEESFAPKNTPRTAPWAWGSGYPQSTYNGSNEVPTLGPNGYGGWIMFPKLFEGRRIKTFRSDLYGADGYVGKSDSDANVQIPGNYRWHGEFFSTNGNGGGNAEGGTNG